MGIQISNIFYVPLTVITANYILYLKEINRSIYLIYFLYFLIFVVTLFTSWTMYIFSVQVVPFVAFLLIVPLAFMYFISKDIDLFRTSTLKLMTLNELTYQKELLLKTQLKTRKTQLKTRKTQKT